MRWGAFLAFFVGLLLAGLVGASLVGLGCDENVRAAETARTDACTAVGEFGGPRWWLLAFAPAVLFFVSAITRWGRDRVGALAATVFVALVAVDAVLIAIATSNLLAP
jgi:2-hydroxychromene-2-carboxylate isomerase